MRVSALAALYTRELEAPERFGAAAAAGFGAVEFLRPYDWPKGTVRGWLPASGLPRSPASTKSATRAA